MSYIRWCGTPNGRIFLQISAITASFASFAAFHLPQSLYLHKYKGIVESYEHGIGQPVPSKSKLLFQQSLADLKVPKREHSLFEIFTVFGFDLFHAGSTAIVSGAIIGIPINFSYESVSDVNKKIKVSGKSVDWESEAGAALSESLVLSEDARRFALAREITSARSSSIWIRSISPFSAILLTYMSCRSINNFFNLRQHPFRMIMYSLVSLFMFSLYGLVNDLTTSYVESSSDERAGYLSQAYAKGGVEFYEKLKQRKQALRKLMGSEGEKLYTVSGNDVIFIRMHTTPLSDRLKLLENIAASFSKTKENSE